MANHLYYGKSSAIFWTLLALGSLTLGPRSALAETLLGKCENPSYSFDLAVDLFKSTDFSIFQLEQSYGAKILVFVGLGVPSEEPTANWFVSGRAAEDEEYCYLGVGLNIEELASPHEIAFKEQFGMPGSGFARCSSKQDLLGGAKVRSWAAKELGDSFVLSLSPGDSGSGRFVLLLSRVDTSWVLLKQQPTGETCYFDRGPFFKSTSLRWEK